MGFPWLKGHGTENDFVLLPDPDGSVHGALDPALVSYLCDRRRGIGADGVLRVVRTSAVAGAVPGAVPGGPVPSGPVPSGPAPGGPAPGGPAPGDSDQVEWFMDYRNADGSVAEMCGNGIRVFVRYLAEQGLLDGPVAPIATRSGVRVVRPADGAGAAAWLGGDLTVEMGSATVVPGTAGVTVRVGDRLWPATGVHVPNPHAVVFVDDLADAGTLATAPEVAPHDVFPDGVNVEFVVRRGPRHAAMRVHERGVGETRSCGTGACAVGVVLAAADDAAPGTAYRVDVPGGRLVVRTRPDGVVELTGPAVLGVRGEFEPEWVTAGISR